MEHQWFKGRGIGKIFNRLHKGTRQELYLRYETEQGEEEISVIFFTEKGVFKFHDIYFMKMKGAVVNIFLSKIINEHEKAQKEFSGKYPGQNIDDVIMP